MAKYSARYKIPYELPLKTDLVLTPHEIAQANGFMNRVTKGKGFILMECEGESGQSFWSPDWTHDAILTLSRMGYIVLVSCIQQRQMVMNLQIETSNKVVWVGSASIRVVAGIYDHCDGFISVSSGLSNACNTKQRRPMEHWIEVVNSLTCSSSAIRSDGKTFWHNNDVNAFCAMLRERFK